MLLYLSEFRQTIEDIFVEYISGMLVIVYNYNNGWIAKKSLCQ